MAKILIVDDAPFIRNQLKLILEPLKFDIIEASDGKEAIEVYKRHNPDIVTMDISMPIMDGVKALSEIIKYDPKAKIIMVSALGHKMRVLEAIEKGASYYIVKPFVSEKVIKTIMMVLNK
ncbi:two-component system, chemotaxis family, response regulator CheY [Marinitoga hydrogenitolerans DSM 16785]|uniref:Two-component system, chemotaxis family, response regulator CheY n=1 Tax=Marinitoga hydrogenitolerans (strain DSM 16785 / JCM 12826 / AT1271) TaxID=1122195 RepID=A0A1M4UTV0_MARH1|nr:response regulator [Marinitoga hydrogenitolerans]SHE60077.1 two-component system, chemotaxis family, response regulator CheY [Marinitoga hydrogenitolerans DSM 16785]